MEYELYHHGIKGQKWGVRRYQNLDGSLTAAGKRRMKYIKNASNIAYNNAERLRKESDKVKENNRQLHENYDGKDGWKEYAKDAYDTIDSKDYGLTEKEFKKWMSDELKGNLKRSDAYDNAKITKYDRAEKKWRDFSKALDRITVNDITKESIRSAKIFCLTQNLGEITLDELVEQAELY